MISCKTFFQIAEYQIQILKSAWSLLLIDSTHCSNTVYLIIMWLHLIHINNLMLSWGEETKAVWQVSSLVWRMFPNTDGLNHGSQNCSKLNKFLLGSFCFSFFLEVWTGKTTRSSTLSNFQRNHLMDFTFSNQKF